MRFWRRIRFLYFALLRRGPRVDGDYMMSRAHLAEWNVLGVLGLWVCIALLAGAAIWLPFAEPPSPAMRDARLPVVPTFFGLLGVAVIAELLWSRRRRGFIERLDVEFAGTDPSKPESKRLLRSTWLIPLSVLIVLTVLDLALAKALGR